MGTMLLMLLSLTVSSESNAPEAEQDWRAQEQSWRAKFQQANKNFKPAASNPEPPVEHTPLPRTRRTVQSRETIDRPERNQYAIVPVPKGFQVVHLTGGRIIPVNEPWDSAVAAQQALKGLTSRAPVASNLGNAIKKSAVQVNHRVKAPAADHKSMVGHGVIPADQRSGVPRPAEDK